MQKDLVAVVTIRKGSQRVKNKNFRYFAGKNLLKHKIEVLKKVKKLDDIIINTDSDEAIETAKDYGVSFQRREDYFTSSECSNSEFWEHIAKQTKSKFILFTHCTNPLVKVETYDNIIKIFKKTEYQNDSINTVNEVKEFLYLENKPLNFNPEKAPGSQDLPNIVKLNFAVNILSTELMAKKKSLVGDNAYFYKLDSIEGYDINTVFEFEYAEYLFKKYMGQNIVK